MIEGWISLHRKVKEHWLWKDPQKFQWWIDILLSVNHTACKVNLGNDLIDCGVGQSVKSLQTWAFEWRVSKDTVRNFFKLLEKDKMVKLENVKISTRITVCNYDSYQQGLHGKQTGGKRQANGKQTTPHPNNNDNNENNENNLPNNGGEPPKEVLNDKEKKFLILFNSICKRQFETMPDKAKKGLKKLIGRGFTTKQFTTSIKNGFIDSKKWPDPSKFTPEYACREAEFEKYLYATIASPNIEQQDYKKKAQEQHKKNYV